MAIAVTFFAFLANYATNLFAANAYSYYGIVFFVSFFVSLTIFVTSDHDVLAKRIIVFMIIGPFVEALLLGILGSATTVAIATLILGLFVYGLSGGLIFGSEYAIKEKL